MNRTRLDTVLKHEMKSWHFFVSVGAIISFALFIFRDPLAEIAWQQAGSPATALVLVRHDADLAMRLGYYYFGNGAYDLEKAERAYKKALAMKPDIERGHYQLARIYFIRGESDIALKEVNEELKLHPNNQRSLYVRGLIYGFRGDLTRAEDDFRAFSEWSPKEWAGYNDLAWILSKIGKYLEAKNTILAAFKNVPAGEKNPWLWNSLGVADLNLKNYRAAAEAFRKAKSFAATINLGEWQSAYPGNDPRQSAEGIKKFLDAIEENLRRAENESN